MLHRTTIASGLITHEQGNQSIRPIIWNLHCPDNMVDLRRHHHLWHMMEGASDDNFHYHVFMPETNTWDDFSRYEVFRIRFPGFLVIKQWGIEQSECVDIDKILNTLRTMFGATERKEGELLSDIKNPF
jgi:hypothetical protein